MSSYNLSEDWQKITETVGYLHNTSQQNIEFVVVDTDVVPPKGSGKVLMPRNYHYFELPTGKEILVRVFRKMPSGYIPTVSVNMTADSMRREDNDLEGSTNCLTIGLSTWRQTSWYPLEWCVIARGSIWQCVKEHEPSEDFLDDVNAGYWQCLSVAGTQVVGVEITNDGKIEVQFGDSTSVEIPIIASKAIADEDGNNIKDVYITKAAVMNALSYFSNSEEMNTAIGVIQTALSASIDDVQGNLDDAVTTINSTTSQIQSDLSDLSDSAVVSVAKENDYSITITHGDDTVATISLGQMTYATLEYIATELLKYVKLSDAVVNVTASATALTKTFGSGTSDTVLTIDTSLSNSSTNPVQNQAIATAIASLDSRVTALENASSSSSSGSGGAGDPGAGGSGGN